MDLLIRKTIPNLSHECLAVRRRSLGLEASSSQDCFVHRDVVAQTRIPRVRKDIPNGLSEVVCGSFILLLPLTLCSLTNVPSQMWLPASSAFFLTQNTMVPLTKPSKMSEAFLHGLKIRKPIPKQNMSSRVCLGKHDMYRGQSGLARRLPPIPEPKATVSTASRGSSRAGGRLERRITSRFGSLGWLVS